MLFRSECKAWEEELFQHASRFEEVDALDCREFGRIEGGDVSATVCTGDCKWSSEKELC